MSKWKIYKYGFTFLMWQYVSKKSQKSATRLWIYSKYNKIRHKQGKGNHQKAHGNSGGAPEHHGSMRLRDTATALHLLPWWFHQSPLNACWENSHDIPAVCFCFFYLPEICGRKWGKRFKIMICSCCTKLYCFWCKSDTAHQWKHSFHHVML